VKPGFEAWDAPEEMWAAGLSYNAGPAARRPARRAA
jgi:hypothetical protein